MIGERIGRFEILSLLGEGGMGQVYRARDPKTGQEAAVKVLLPKFSGVEPIVRRFFNEAMAAGATHHPGIVDVYESGYSGESGESGTGAETSSAEAYIALELIDGEPLTDLIERETRLESADLLSLGVQICLALAAAHDKGIIHRDLKPDNIMLIVDDTQSCGWRIKVLDFGLAKLLDDLGQQSVRTNTGITMGTPSYMAPEQWRASREIDHRADIYGLGCVLFHLACGRPPFVYDGFADKMRAHLTEKPADPRTLAPNVGDKLAALLLNMLEKDPRDRYQTMTDVAAALSAIERDDELPSAPTRAATADLRSGKESGKESHRGHDAGAPAPSLHPSMPPTPSLPQVSTTRLPVALIAVVAIAIAGAIIAWRFLI